MPELPEVELIARILNGCLAGKKITAIKFFYTGMLGRLSAEDFVEKVQGKQILKVSRRGKYLHFCLTGEKILEVHLRMTGAFFFFQEAHRVDKYVRAVFFLEGGSELHFRDIRKFATFRLWDKGELEKFNRTRLGPDLLEDVHGFHFFLEGLKKKPKSRLKTFLLDQKNFSGLGNIYTDEALFRACLNPSRRVGTLNFSEQLNLWRSIQNVLQEGIEHGGVSVANYQDPYGRPGEFQKRLKVYRRENEPCPRCGHVIVRRVVAGRGTYFCPACQVF
ncbi:MAG: DNA-formamidopyrimidine glycosylase [Firmicutes bacterium]|nr:DNA-formamidopyrimidine glycosylase [Bacillota bacterium]